MSYSFIDMRSWALNFRLSADAVDELCALGGDSIEDLVLMYTDDDIIAEIKSNLSLLDMAKFKKARSQTKGANADIVSSAVVAVSRDKVDKSVALRRMDDLAAGLAALNVQQEDLRAEFKMFRMEQELRQLEIEEVKRENAAVLQRENAPVVLTITRSISSVILTVERSIERSIENEKWGADGNLRMRTYTMDREVPVWDSLPWEECHIFGLRWPESISELVNARIDYVLDPFPIRCTVRCAAHPFDKGCLRAAFRAQVKDDVVTNVIQKESMAAHKDECTREKYEETLACHRAAAYLAKEFNKVKPRFCPFIMYCDVYVLQFMVRPGQPFRTQESMIDGVWEKYSNNSGYCAPMPTDAGVNHAAVQAFSHWTYHVTEGKLMVVDCQGAYDAGNKTFVLSDPALHAVDVLRFGGTNLSSTGFADFFKTHYCNGHCKAMGLPDVPH